MREKIKKHKGFGCRGLETGEKEPDAGLGGDIFSLLLKGDGIIELRQSRRRPLSPQRILCNIAAEGQSQWLWCPSRRLLKLVIAIASVDAMSWPACAMKTPERATAPRAGKTIWS